MQLSVSSPSALDPNLAALLLGGFSPCAPTPEASVPATGFAGLLDGAAAPANTAAEPLPPAEDAISDVAPTTDTGVAGVWPFATPLPTMEYRAPASFAVAGLPTRDATRAKTDAPELTALGPTEIEPTVAIPAPAMAPSSVSPKVANSVAAMPRAERKLSTAAQIESPAPLRASIENVAVVANPLPLDSEPEGEAENENPNVVIEREGSTEGRPQRGAVARATEVDLENEAIPQAPASASPESTPAPASPRFALRSEPAASFAETKLASPLVEQTEQTGVPVFSESETEFPLPHSDSLFPHPGSPLAHSGLPLTRESAPESLPTLDVDLAVARQGAVGTQAKPESAEPVSIAPAQTRVRLAVAGEEMPEAEITPTVVVKNGRSVRLATTESAAIADNRLPVDGPLSRDPEKIAVFQRPESERIERTFSVPTKNFLSAEDKQVAPRGDSLGTGVAKPAPVMFSLASPFHSASALADSSALAPAAVTEAQDVSVVVPEMQPEAAHGAHRAVEAALSAAERVGSADRHAVNLQFSVAGADLKVRVELHADEVRTTFATDSAELRAALSHEWHAAVAAAPERSLRLATPVFSTDSASLSSFSDSGASDRRDSRANRAPEEFANGGARGRTSRVSGPATTSAALPASRVSPSSTQLLHTLA